MSGLLARLLPPGMHGAEIADVGQAVALHPDEAPFIAGAGDKRRRDFTLGRACAHAALGQIGRDEGAIGKAPNGAPVWPAGVAGSLTHTRGYAAAVASLQFAAIGLDAERIGGVTADLWPRMFNTAERAALAADPNAALLATLFFCAKEAAYKAWQIQGLAFRDMTVARDGGGFAVTLAGNTLNGRHAFEGDLMLALAWR